MKNPRTLIATALMASALSAHAADQLLPGRSLVMRAASSKRRTSFLVKSAAFTAPAPGGPDDPRTAGAALEIRAPSGETATLDLPAAGWSANQAGTVYHFRSADPASAVKAAVLRGGSILKVVARSTGITLDEPAQGGIGLILTTGTARDCAVFGGNVTHDEPGLFVAKRAPAPTACPGPCDFLDPSVCLYPFPNDWFTVSDATTDTGRRVHFSVDEMPRNTDGTPIEPSDYDLNDGFSPGASILLRVPGVDLGATGAAPITDMARSLDGDAPIVLVNAATLEHHLMWAEIDSNATSEATRAVIIRPAVNLAEATRYIVALRRMKDGNGGIIAPNPDFLAYRDGTPTGDPFKEVRRAHMESLFTTLAAAGVARDDLYLAWDFTVASRRNITARLLFMRDDGFARLGTSAPTFAVTQVENDVNGNIYRRVTGTYQVDRYVDATTAPARLVLDPNGLPVHQSTPQPASFICLIPRAALPSATDPATPARASIYGHGLLGSNTEVNAGNVQAMANEHNFVFCATKWIGMSDEDVVNAITILQNLARFPSLADRLQQGMLDQLFLARLMIHPQGFVSDPAFQDAFGTPVIDTSAVFYDGNSQGGIFGGTVMAVATDITRGVLGVPGMNYSTLLTRSTDFAAYSAILYPKYPNELERPLLLALIQMLWDRSDPNGYAHHMTTDPLPNTPLHTVLLHEAFGDHQVANVATEVEARTIGASIHQPAIASGRNPDVVPYFGIPAIPSYPFAGSALIVWDSGTEPPPTTNTAPMPGRCADDATKECSVDADCPGSSCTLIPTAFDPHSDPRNFVDARTQKSEFLKTNGAVVDVCSGAPCMAPH